MNGRVATSRFAPKGEETMRDGEPKHGGLLGLLARLRGAFEGLGLAAMRDFQNAPLDSLVRRQREGGASRFAFFGTPHLYLAEPEDVEWMLRQRSDVLTKDMFLKELERIIGHGLLVSEGEFWRKQRGLVAHAFTPKRIRGYGDAMATIAERFAARLVDGSVIDVHASMNQVTMEIVAKTLFDADVADKGGEVGHALEGIMDFYANSPEMMFRMPDWLPTPRMRRFVEGRESVRRIVGEIIRDRRATGVDRGDLLSAMLASREEDGSPMSDDQLRDECVTLFLAGHETTSLLLAHTFVLLSYHPDVAARVRAEADRVFSGRTPTADDAKLLTYTEQVLTEALRLYPSAWVVGREAATTIERNGIRIEKGTQLLASQWAMHRDPRFFPNPEAFIPERWTDDMRRRLPRGAFFPFGDGPRICVGNHFAMLESTLILATIARVASLELVPGERLEFAPSVTLRTRRGVAMRVRKLAPRAAVVDVRVN